MYSVACDIDVGVYLLCGRDLWMYPIGIYRYEIRCIAIIRYVGNSVSFLMCVLHAIQLVYL